MLRGEISNRPAAVIALDYRIILNQRKSYLWFVEKVPELLLEKGFENAMKKALPWRPGARLWLELNEGHRLAVFTVGTPLISRAIEMLVGTHIAECYHFEDRYQFRHWTRVSKNLGKVFTNDPALIGLDEIIQPHSGWTEEI